MAGLSEEFLDLYTASGNRAEGPVLYSEAIDPMHEPHLRGHELFVRTMYEADTMPETWLPVLNQARCVIVPTAFNVEMFRRAGVRPPIEVLPDGIDPQVYAYRERPERTTFTTLLVATDLPRKHHREAVAGWRQAFDGDPDARLIIKTRVNDSLSVRADPRITIVGRDEWGRGIAHWYAAADVLVAVGNEGFGLPLIEAMATGLPVVALDSEGQRDVCRAVPDLVLSVQPDGWMSTSYRVDGRPTGRLAVPSVGQIAERLRWAADHRDEARDMGRAASAWVHRERDVWRYGPDMLAIIEQHRTTSRRGKTRASG